MSTFRTALARRPVKLVSALRTRPLRGNLRTQREYDEDASKNRYPNTHGIRDMRAMSKRRHRRRRPSRQQGNTAHHVQRLACLEISLSHRCLVHAQAAYALDLLDIHFAAMPTREHRIHFYGTFFAKPPATPYAQPDRRPLPMHITIHHCSTSITMRSSVRHTRVFIMPRNRQSCNSGTQRHHTRPILTAGRPRQTTGVRPPCAPGPRKTLRTKRQLRTTTPRRRFP